MTDYTFDWHEVWITGNGPSSSRVTIPDGASVLAINDSVFRTLAANRYRVAFFTLDKDWVRKHTGWLSWFPGEKHVALPLTTWPDCDGIAGVTYHGWSHVEGLSDDPGVIATGQNSGYGAINLCYLNGTKLIHLVGYDMDPIHNPNYRFWAPFFAHALPQLEAAGVKVLNHNPNSFVKAFPFADGFADGGYVLNPKQYVVGEY